ncbi:MAG: hypothetical protein ACR2G0_08015 [Chthoniobacterales bacterium]
MIPPSLPRLADSLFLSLAFALFSTFFVSHCEAGDFDETLTFTNNKVPGGWTIETLAGAASNAQVTNMRFQVTSGTDAALDRDAPLPLGTNSVEITLRCDLVSENEGIGYKIHLLMQDGSDYVVSIVKQAGANRLNVIIGNTASPALNDFVYTLNYGVYTLDALFTDGRIIFNGTKEVGGLNPSKTVEVPGLTVSDLKTVRLEASDGGTSTAWIDDVQVLAITGDQGVTRLSNISTRANVRLGDNVLIGGFIIGGGAKKNVILRALGPSLGFEGTLADPNLELHNSSGATIATNDNWKDSSETQAIIDSGLPPTNDAEAAIFMSLSPGLYTAVVRGQNATTGVALVEVYDIDRDPSSALENISTRSSVLTGDEVMIGGLIVAGPSAEQILLRALGPSLSVSGAMADPVLELFNSNGDSIGLNDNWRSDLEADITATTIAPTEDLESAILATIVPGAYTAIVRGHNDTTGVALVEAYQLK